jgi:hypothetical protein
MFLELRVVVQMLQLLRGNVQSANVEAAVPTELQTLLYRFTTTGCFPLCLSPGVPICHYQNAVLYVCTKRIESHAYIHVLWRVRKIAKSNY